MVKRIAIVCGNLSSQGGGVPRSVSQQALILKEAELDVTLFSGYSRKYPFTPEELGISQCNVFTSPLWSFGFLGFFPKALLTLWKLSPNIDVIHLNGAWNLTTFLGALIARSRNVPYIISCRSHFGDYHFSRKPFLKKLLFLLIERANIRHALALHVTAEWEAKTSWRAVNLASRVVIIPNPVNLSDFQSPPTRKESRERLDLAEDGFYVLHLGRLGKQKNLSFLVNAFHEAQLGEDARLIFIGPPEAEEKQKLTRQIEQLGLKKQVRFIDFAEGRDRCLWFAAADLFALPSFDENFCVSAIESVASGTHCLLSPHVGVTGFLPRELVDVLPFEIGQWSATLQKAYRNRPLQQLLPPDMSSFSNESIAEKWKQFYRHTIA